MNEKAKIIIIGNGAAGYNASKAIREKDKDCAVTLISKEEVRSYYRPKLSTLIGKEIPENRFYITSEQWYEENGIQQLLGTEVVEIKPEDKRLVLESGEELAYDKLILANGSYNFILPIKISDTTLSRDNYKKFNGIYSIKDLKDALEVKAHMEKSKHAVVIGGGLLGLEAAWEMKEMGLKVSVVEFFPRLLPKQLDVEGGRLLESIVSEGGIDIFLGDCAEELLIENNSIKSIKLQSGKVLNCDLLLFSVGIRSNIDLPKKAGIQVNKGILVNNKMETNIPGIYACGDSVEHNGIIYGNWAAAMDMGRIAGSNASGASEEFVGFVPSLMFNSMGTKVFSSGNINFEDPFLEQLSYKDDKNYRKLFFLNNKLQGGILIGNIALTGKITAGVKKGISKEEALESGMV